MMIDDCGLMNEDKRGRGWGEIDAVLFVADEE
jgi:hypothetical protein